MLRSGWFPAALVLALAVGLLLRYDTPAGDVVKYLAYFAFGLVLPGTLVWRALRGTPRSFLEDITMGTALGYALEIPAYLATTALGVSWLVVARPAVVIVLFLAVPSLRRHWRPAGTPRLSTGLAWTLAGVVAVLLLWLTGTFFVGNGLSGEAARAPYFDMPFHLALAGEVKHHVPPRIPFVVDEPLSYHWFVHAHMASASTITGIELPVILYRLFLFPMVVLGALGIAILGARVAKRQWAGPATLVVAYFISTLSPYLWLYGGYMEVRLLNDRLWASPTQTFGTMLATPAVLLIIDRLRREPGSGAGQWALIAIFLGVLTGAKATYLPVIGAGLALVLAVTLLFRRTLDRVALAAVVVTATAFAFATFVLLGGASQALVFDPLRTTTQLPVVSVTQLLRGVQGPPLWVAVRCLPGQENSVSNRASASLARV